MGDAIKKGIAEGGGVWSREDLVTTTKIYDGTKCFMDPGPNDQGLSRKHIVEGMKASPRRLDQDDVNALYCHHREPYTPIEETDGPRQWRHEPRDASVATAEEATG